MKTLKTVLIMIVLLTLSTTALALTPSEIVNSPLSSTQKVEIADALLNATTPADTATVETNFNKLVAEAETEAAKAKLQQMREQLQAEAEAEVAAQQKQIKSDLVALVKPLKISDVWPAAKAFADSNQIDEDFVATTLALRYKLTGDFVTIDAVQTAYEARAELKKTILDVTAPQRHLMATGLEAHNEAFRLTIAQLDTMNRRLDTVETDNVQLKADVATLLKAKEDYGVNLTALNEFVITTDSNGEVNKASQERFGKALSRANKNVNED